MKNKASLLMKNTISVISNIVRAKLMGVKSKANAMRVRLLVFSLLKSRKLSLGSLSNKIQALLDKKSNDEVHEQDDDNKKQINNVDEDGEEEEDRSKAIVLYDANYSSYYYDQEDDDKYPDLTHSLFEEEDDGFDYDQGGSVIDLVKNSKENGGDFSLEAEIDQVADLFIRRFKKHMRLEKLESFKRYQAMLGRSA